jgi:CubicO group peptidase (beta-lactamase class C family)
VARRGPVVLASGFGRRSGEPAAPAVDADSVFMLASITKPITAMALMMLVEEGALSLADPVRLHIPGFSEGERAAATVRLLRTPTPRHGGLMRWCHQVRQLLTHTAGLPDMLPENLALREVRHL